VIAVDTNILVYAHREDSPWHAKAVEVMAPLARAAWAIPWPCLHEFLAIVTHPGIFSPPSPPEKARAAVSRWLASPRLHLLAEADGYWRVLEEVLRDSRVVGPRVHDSRVAALCLLHGVDTLWTADRDFSRFTKLRATNPLLSS